MTDPPKVIYLTGWGRSGSTILNRLLIGEHVVGVGELRLLWQRGVLGHQDCSCGNAWDECELWHPVVRAVLTERTEVDPAAAARRFHDLGRRAGRALTRRPHHLGRVSREYAAVLGDVYRSIAEQTQARVIVDSSKNPMHALLARASGADVTVVHLVRDPRGVVWSHQRVKVPPPGAAANTTEPQGPLYIATRWTARNSFIDRNVEPDLRIRYEDMVADTERTTKTIFATAGTEVPPAGGGAEHLIAGNPNRFEAVGRTVLQVDDEWRVAQPAGQKRLIELVAGRVMRRYGYTDE
jgi:hypothetical protein